MRLHLTALLIAASLGATAFAVEATPTGTIGTEFNVTFDQDVGTRPKIVLTFEPSDPPAKAPKAVAKLISSTGTSATFFLQAATGGGTFSVGVKGSDASGGSIFLAGPDAQEYSTDTVAAGGSMSISGDYFGELQDKRNAPKVYVGGKKAKVTSFSNTELEIELSKATPTGTQDIRVVNKIGESVIVDAVLVTGPPKPISGPNSIYAKLSTGTFKAVESKKNPAGARAVFNIANNVL